MRRTWALSLVVLAQASGCAPETAARARLSLEPVAQIPGLVETKLHVDDADAAEFGTSVAAMRWGALVGAPSLVVNGAAVGGVIPFARNDGVWSAEDPLVASDQNEGQRFGRVLAAFNDAVAIGGPNPDTGMGRVWTFDRIGPGVWRQGTTLTPEGQLNERSFGRSLAMSGDALVVGSGAVGDDDVTYEGLAYVFERQGDGNWAKVSALQPEDASNSGPSYSWSVAVNDEIAAVGAPYAGDAGLVHVFSRADGWRRAQILDGTQDAGALAGASFGEALVVHGESIFVGAPYDDTGLTGAVYIFERGEDRTWRLQRKLISRSGSTPDGALYDAFGLSLGIALGRLFVGAPSLSSATARVQVFGLDGSTDELARLPVEPDADVAAFAGVLSTSSASIVTSAMYRAYVFELEPGAPCTHASECATGHCVDGVCCKSQCSGCNTCLAALKASGPSGECGPVRAGTDPANFCSVSEEVCGNTGLCDGRGACAKPGSDVECTEPSCVSPNEVRAAGYCNGEGVCIPGSITRCETGYACSGAECTSDCFAHPDCADGFYCWESECVSGSRCSEDRRAAYDERGKRESCGLTYCKSGVCSSNCETGADCVSGICDSFSGTCSAACSETSECDSGSYCLEGVCVHGAQCSQDGRVAYDAAGQATPCTLGYCSAGACANQCEQASDCISGACDRGKGICLLTCLEGSDCAGDSYCLDGICVSGPTCSVDRRFAYDVRGQATACAVFCRDGACPDTCQATVECVSGVCHPARRVCVDSNALAPARVEAGCSFRADDHLGVKSSVGIGIFVVGLRRRLKRVRGRVC